MPSTITFNIANSNNKKYTLLVEDQNLPRSIVKVYKNNTINRSDAEKLKQFASKSGDIGVLEHCDLDGQSKLNLAKLNNFDEYYDIKLSNDKKMFVITVKKTGPITPNPTVRTIKADFGVRDNVLVKKGNIPYGNEGIFEKRAESGSSPDGRNTDYDAAKLEAGDTINIPVSEININDTPRGFLGRLFKN